MRIVLAGGTGQIGRLLTRHFLAQGHEVVVLGRSEVRVPAPARFARWNPPEQGGWAREIDGADVLVNLAGRSVNCCYGAKNRREIINSRTDSTRALAEAVASANAPPPVWLQSSTATIYAHRFDAANDEFTGEVGGREPDAPDTWRFSIDVARAWEAAALERPLPATRVVLMRSAMVMSPDAGGVFRVLSNLVRAGLGGADGDGRQFVSWIHERDFCRAVDWLIARPELSGPVNLAAPGPLPNRDFMRTLRRAWGVSFGMPKYRWMLEVGALLMRTETELLLKSRRVVPGRLLRDGFAFQFPEWEPAAVDLVRQVRGTRVS